MKKLNDIQVLAIACLVGCIILAIIDAIGGHH